MFHPLGFFGCRRLFPSTACLLFLLIMISWLVLVILVWQIIEATGLQNRHMFTSEFKYVLKGPHLKHEHVGGATLHLFASSFFALSIDSTLLQVAH